MRKFTRFLFLTFATVYGLNALYVIFFISSKDEIRLFSFWETNKWVAGLVYLFFSFIFLSSERVKIKNKEEPIE
ncbi:hypothetical protein [Algoriphagus sp.]|uniref:hypothetical protein n=1 Tax=Algoriphagus sp. TaxID=1872435 RepID=UPI00391A84FD